MRFVLALAVFCFVLTFTVKAAPPPAELFGSLPKIHDAAISPTGKQVALIRIVRGKYAVQVKTLGDENEKPRLIGLEEGVKPISVVWVNPDRLIIAFWQSNKLRDVPYTSGFLFSLDTRKMQGKILVKPKRGIFRQFNHVIVDYLEDDPDHILMAFSKDDNNVKPGLRKVNVATGRSQVVKRGITNVQEWYTDLQGEPRVGQGRRDLEVEQWVLRIRDPETNEWGRAADYPNLDADVDIRGFTSDPNEMIIADYQGKDTVGLYIYDLQEKKITRKLFHNDTYDANDVILSHDGAEVIGASYVGETVEVELFEGHATTLSKLRKEYNDYTVDYIDQSNDGGLVLVKISNAYEPGMVAMYDASKNTLEVMGGLYPDLRSSQLGEVVSVGYAARDGVKIPSFVTLPPSVTDSSQLKNLPFIILPHGGPYGRDEKRFDYFAQFFASRGFGVMQMNFRGSDGYGKTFEDSGRENWVVMQEDVEDAALSLIERGYADPKRICIVGWSYGGYAALMGALKTPELYSCAISMAGVTDLQDMIRDIKKYRFGRSTARNFVLKGFENKDDIKANSPVKLASELKVPLLLAHGRDDQRVHFDQFNRMKKALRKVDVPVTYMAFSDEDHFLSNQVNRIEFFKGIDKFLVETVGKSEFAE